MWGGWPQHPLLFCMRGREAARRAARAGRTPTRRSGAAEAGARKSIVLFCSRDMDALDRQFKV